MFNKSSSYGGGARRLTEQSVAYSGLTVDPVSGQITGTEEESLANVLVKMSPELFLTDQGVK